MTKYRFYFLFKFKKIQLNVRFLNYLKVPKGGPDLDISQINVPICPVRMKKEGKRAPFYL